MKLQWMEFSSKNWKSSKIWATTITGQWTVHTRAIGDSRYSILKLVDKENGEVKEEHIDTNMMIVN